MSLDELIEDKWHEDDQSGKSIEGRKADEDDHEPIGRREAHEILVEIVTKGAKPNPFPQYETRAALDDPFPQWKVIEKALEEARRNQS